MAGELEADNAFTWWLAETLLQPARADAFGGVVTWFETPVGRDLIRRVIPRPESDYRFPMLLRTAGLWEVERRGALKRFRRN